MIDWLRNRGGRNYSKHSDRRQHGYCRRHRCQHSDLREDHCGKRGLAMNPLYMKLINRMTFQASSGQLTGSVVLDNVKFTNVGAGLVDGGGLTKLGGGTQT